MTTQSTSPSLFCVSGQIATCHQARPATRRDGPGWTVQVNARIAADLVESAQSDLIGALSR
jgi:hypothetical protein